MPGCVAATPVEAPINPVDGYPLEMPLVYFYGHSSPSDNPQLYKVRACMRACMGAWMQDCRPKAVMESTCMHGLCGRSPMQAGREGGMSVRRCMLQWVHAYVFVCASAPSPPPATGRRLPA